MDFDKQAPIYDKRVGLPPTVAEKIARAVASLPKKLPHLNVLEVGAGTGEIGCEIASLVNNYIAIDNSPRMLNQFRLRCKKKKGTAKILLADGNLPWPVAPGDINLIFSSRALHLLDFEHATKELTRLSQNSRLWLIIGKVQKDSNGIPAMMRRTMRQLLSAQGIEGRSGKRHKEKILQFFREKGAEIIPRTQVASWQKAYAPIQSIKAWRNKSGLAGTAISPEVKTHVLDQVEAWAKDYFGNINQTQPSSFHYELNGICL